MRRLAKADVKPVRQRSQFSCVASSTCMALNALGVKCTEDQVNEVIGAKPMQGARWEEVLACAQYFGCRATLTTPATLTQVKAWTDAGKPVLIAWNPEGRDWSHASLIFDVTGEKGSYVVHVADPNIPNPDKTTREVSEDEFYSKWFEKWPNYLVRRPALMIEREISEDGRQIMASAGGFNARVSRLMRRIAELEKSMTDENMFFDNPDKRNVRQFAESGAITNKIEVVQNAVENIDLDKPDALVKSEAILAPPTPEENREKPGGKGFSTLNRFVVETAEKIKGLPESRDGIPKAKPPMSKDPSKSEIKKDLVDKVVERHLNPKDKMKAVKNVLTQRD